MDKICPYRRIELSQHIQAIVQNSWDILCLSGMLKSGMNIKDERIKKIKKFLRFQMTAVSVTEIHDALLKRMHLEFSRKTIERDITNLVEKKVVIVLGGVPSRHQLNNPSEFEILLKVEEIQLILALMNPETELSLRLKKLLIP